MHPFCPESILPQTLHAPATTNGGFTTRYVSLKTALKAFLIVHLKQAVAHATAFTPVQASAVAGTGSKALSANTRIWANDAILTGTALTRQTDAKNFTVAATATDKTVVFEIDPADLDHVNGFDCIGLTAANSSQATDFAAIELLIIPHYQDDAAASNVAD